MKYQCFQDSKLIIEELSKMKLRKGIDFYSENLLMIYKKLVKLNIFKKTELIFFKKNG